MCPPPSTLSDQDGGSVERSFTADTREVRQAVEFASSQAAAAGLEPRRVARLELAVEEVAVNVCRYAYGGGPGNFLVRVAAVPGGVAVEIVDRGAAFDPLALPDPDLDSPLEERKVGGLGVHLVRQLVDEASYRREPDGNVLTLVLRNPP